MHRLVRTLQYFTDFEYVAHVWFLLWLKFTVTIKPFVSNQKDLGAGVILTISSQKTKQSNKNKIAQIKYRQNKHTFDENERASETF